MPVILDASDFDRWLDPAVQEPKKLEPLLVPYGGEDLAAYRISTWVNSPRNQGPRFNEPAAASG
jgi:putative SOS response-associated peptidase YedK